MNSSPFPVLQTERLLLRAVEFGDCEAVFFLRSNEIVNQFIKRTKTENLEDALAFIEKIKERIANNLILYWAITLQDNATMIGSICLWKFSENGEEAEVGYDLHPDFQKKGIMSEALDCVVNFGFQQLKLIKIKAYTHCANEPSISLLIKNHFQPVIDEIDEGNLDNVIFERLNHCCSKK